MIEEKDIKALMKVRQKRKTYTPKEKNLCKLFYSQFKQLQALNQISNETLLILLPNQRKSSTYKIAEDDKGNKIGYDPFKDDNNYKFYNKIKKNKDFLYIMELKRQGLVDGLPDYLVLNPCIFTQTIVPFTSLPKAGQLIAYDNSNTEGCGFGFIEVKVDNNDLSDAQEWFRDYCFKHNIPWHFLKNAQGFEKTFEFIKGI